MVEILHPDQYYLEVMVIAKAKSLRELNIQDVNQKLLTALNATPATEQVGLKIKALSVFVLEMQTGIKDESSIKELFKFITEGWFWLTQYAQVRALQS